MEKLNEAFAIPELNVEINILRPLPPGGKGSCTRHACNRPACLRQTARKGRTRHIGRVPLRAGHLLFGARFFSDRNVELTLCDVYHLVIKLSLYLGVFQTGAEDFQLGTEGRYRLLTGRGNI